MYRRLILSIFLILLAAKISSGVELDIASGRIAVHIKPPKLASDLEYDSSNFDACIVAHIDYYLWSKGWEFEIVPYRQDLNLSHPAISDEFKNFRYLLYLTPGVKFKRQIIDGKSSTEDSQITAQIELKIDFIDLDSSSYLIKGQKKKARPLEDWVTPGDSLLRENGLPHIEPPDFVLKRLLSESLEFLPRVAPAKFSYDSSLPIRLIIDSRIANDIKGGMEKELMRALEYASRSLWRQFGVALQNPSLDYFSVKEITYSDIERLFRSFIRGGLPASDTLTVAVFRPARAADYYIGNSDIQAGLSDLGRKTAMIAEISPPNSATREWKVFLDGQLLLHEIGHLLGAVHVSDINSIMTSSPLWLSSDRFDRLNSHIIRGGLKDNSSFDRVTTYLTTVIHAIDETAYPLTDLPSTFFTYINLNHKDLMTGRLAETPTGQAAIYGSDGYRAYLLKDSLGAKNAFYRALAENPLQAAFHYYLGQVTSGALAQFHLNQAASLGYYNALHDLALKRK